MLYWLRLTCVYSIGLLVGATSAGCIVAGYVAHIYGDPPVAAKYVLPTTRPSAVVVKEPPDPTGQMIESEVVASDIEQELKAHTTGPLVSSVKASDLRSSDPQKFETMSPADIGRAIGAEQVVYVEVLRSGLSAGEGNDMFKGQIAATVAVYDAASGKMLWPTDGSAGETVTYGTPMLRANEETNALSVRRNLHAGLANKVAKLFYKYKPDED